MTIRQRIDSIDKVQMKKKGRKAQAVLIWLLKAVILVGISYIILGPVITMISNAFFTSDDLYNPVVVLFPVEGTLENFRGAFRTMAYPRC